MPLLLQKVGVRKALSGSKTYKDYFQKQIYWFAKKFEDY